MIQVDEQTWRQLGEALTAWQADNAKAEAAIAAAPRPEHYKRAGDYEAAKDLHAGFVAGRNFSSDSDAKLCDIAEKLGFKSREGPATQRPLPDLPEPPQNVLIKYNEDVRHPVK